MENRDASHPVTDKTVPLMITGAAGFIGRNLAATLRAEGWQNLLLLDLDSPEGALEDYAGKAAFVFHLAGVNRPQNTEEFYTGNAGLTQRLLAALRAAGNKAPVLLSSSAHAGNGTDYAKSKEEAEPALFDHARLNGSPVYAYRLPGVFGKWSRPNYNTVVATFCHNVARGLPLEIRDPAYAFALCYIDDVVRSFMARLEGTAPAGEAPAASGTTCGIDPSYEVSLGWLAGTIRSFAATRQNLTVPDMGDDLTRKLWATYLSFIPENKLSYPLRSNVDDRGSFTEFLRSHESGQVSVNVAKPGIVKGNHWHNTKNEKFLVVSGRAVIRLRRIGTKDVVAYPVSGEKLEVIDIQPGSTHNIENVGEGDLVTLMWASEPFDPDSPDTYFEKV